MPSNQKRHRTNRRQAIFVVCVLLLFVFGYLTFAEHLASEDRVTAYFVRSDGTKTGEFHLEIAATRAERGKGLMFRKPGDMKRDEGMIFIFPKQEIQSFWMKNTYISLDMLFVNDKYEVVGVIRDVPILNDIPRKVTRPSTFVVELLAGVAKQHNISVGNTLIVDKKLPEPS